MSEEFSASTESIMADALAAKGVPVPAEAPRSSAFLDAPPQEDSTMRTGAFTSSLTEDIMAAALADAGKLPGQEAGVETAADGIDANPWKTAQAAEAFAVGAGIEPGLAKFYSGRIEKSLKQPAMSPEAQ